MDVLGFWKVKKVMMFGEDDSDPWRSVEEVLESGFEDTEMLTARFFFDEDGSVKVVAPLPEGVSQEEVDRAVKAGKVHLFGESSMVIGRYSWKEEGGKLFVDSGFGGGEPDWAEVTETDGMLDFLMYKLARE
jgi:hypothetical protein